MQLQELEDIVRALRSTNSDDSHIEAKLAKGGLPKRLWETISAFSNTSGGGVIILGIEETEGKVDVIGVTNPAKFQADLASVCDQMEPPVRALIEVHEYQGVQLVTAEIPEVDYRAKPCFYKGSGMVSGSFIRVFDGDRQLTQYEVQGYLDGRGQPQYDIAPVPDAGEESLSKELVAAFLARVRRNADKYAGWDDRKILRTHRVIAEHEGRIVPTLAGLLCCGSYPQEFFPSLTMHVLAYPTRTEGQTGDRGERLVDNQKIEGPLPAMIAEALRIIKRNIQKGRLVKGMLGDDLLEYPEDFIREALVNAVGHRDYQPLARGSAVQVKLFPDRMEIANPGGLFGLVTTDRLGEQGLQATRNSHLMKMLEDMPVPGEDRVLCENRGTGILTMLQALRKAGMEPPQFRDSRTQFFVVCTNHTMLDRDTLAWLAQFAGEKLSDAQRAALAFVRHRERITNPEYCRLNECDSRAAGRELAGLVEKRLLKPMSARRWAHYVLAVPAAIGVVPPATGRRKDRSTDILAFLRIKKVASTREIAVALGLALPATYYWLRKTVKAGQVKPTTAAVRSPNVKYKLTGR